MASPAAQLAPLPDGPHTTDDLAAREEQIRTACAAWSLQWAGLVANPTAGDDAYARYCDLIAPGETEQRRREMASASGCALFARAYARAMLRDLPRCLTSPYVTGMAMRDVDTIARAAGAARTPPCAPPRVGDVVRVGAPEHVYVVVGVDPRDDGPWRVESVAGWVGGDRVAVAHHHADVA